MKVKNLIITTIVPAIFLFTSCAEKEMNLGKAHLELVNRKIVATDEKGTNMLALNAEKGGGMAVIKDVNFDAGTIALELKGENNPGRSFIGLAFNIQNDSTYEAVYFRPFNFKSDKSLSREHSIQYIAPPQYSWELLRTRHEGVYEAEYPDPPSPDKWFGIKVKIDSSKVYVYDTKSGTELLSVNRLKEQVSDKIGLWTGNNSKGAFKNMRILK